MSFYDGERLGSPANPELFFYGEQFNNAARAEAQIESLSGAFHEEALNHRLSGHIVTNDHFTEHLISTVKERITNISDQGVGLFIGSGGHLSLLPHLNIAFPVVVDINLAVLECSAIMRKLIIERQEELKTLPNEVDVRHYAASALADIYDDPTKDEGLRFGFNYFEWRLEQETTKLGKLHWSHPENINNVAEALKKKPPIYMLADISNPTMIKQFRAICNDHDLQITFANFTNVKEYLSLRDKQHMALLPTDPHAVILYSNVVSGLVSTPVTSLEAYLQADIVKTPVQYQS